MTSKLTPKFREDFDALPKEIQALARQSYRLWRQDPNHISLRFKQVHPSYPYYSVRIGERRIVLGEKEGNKITWSRILPC